MKILTPNNFFILRGNHEVREIQEQFSFYRECYTRYSDELWDIINMAFDRLPIAATIDDKVYCAHGVNTMVLCIDQIRSIPSPLDNPILQSVETWEILWNDPGLITFVLVIVSVMQASFGHHIFGLFAFISLAKIVSTSMTNALQSNMSPTSSRTIKICLSLVNYLMYTLVTIAVLVCLHSLTVGQWHRTGHYLNDLLIATRHTFIYGLSGILVGLFCDYNFVNFQSVLIKGQIIALISALLWWAITGQIIIYFYRVQFGSFLFHLTNDTKALMVDAVKLSIDNHKPRTFLTVSPIKLPDHKPAIRQIYYHLLAMFSMKFLEVPNTS